MKKLVDLVPNRLNEVIRVKSYPTPKQYIRTINICLYRVFKRIEGEDIRQLIVSKYENDVSLTKTIRCLGEMILLERVDFLIKCLTMLIVSICIHSLVKNGRFVRSLVSQN